MCRIIINVFTFFLFNYCTVYHYCCFQLNSVVKCFFHYSDYKCSAKAMRISVLPKWIIILKSMRITTLVKSTISAKLAYMGIGNKSLINHSSHNLLHQWHLTDSSPPHRYATSSTYPLRTSSNLLL